MSSDPSAAAVLRLPQRVLHPERKDPSTHWLDRLAVAAHGVAAARGPVLRARRFKRIVEAVKAHQAPLEAADDARLQAWAGELRRDLRTHGLRDDAVARAFALVREIAGRTMGMRHFDVQLIGGCALLMGNVAEMETGEGKTLTATLAACTAALAGTPVHVVTVNDYLAKRDAGTMAPIYEALGLTVGVVIEGMQPDARRAAYLCDIAYCTNKEIAFDYLRDRMALGSKPGNLRLKVEQLGGAGARADKTVMRGLHFAIVDEADSVLIDEARTPLIISSQSGAGDEQRKAERALELVADLEEGVDYQVHVDERRVELSDRGKARLRALAMPLGGMWRGTILREEMAHHALSAKHLFVRDEHYLVRDGKVQIIDEYTGRVMADRFWSEGLHQLIEVKEGCPASGRKVTLARMTYQRFFRRYKRLGGMTGTVREVAGELWSVYRLPVVRVPTNRPVRRVHHPDRVCPTADEKWRLIADRVVELVDRGRPVLVGTRSVAASESASRHLEFAGIEHRVLSAAQDADEAQIVAEAGGAARVTIATNMAGRGTDIKLGDGVADRGGLHVIMSERHDARRIDFQLAGRAGRQGDPGSVEAILSLEDPLLEVVGGRVQRRLVTVLARLAGRRLLFGYAQWRAERVHSGMRRDLLKADEKLGDTLAFSGQLE